MRSTQVALAVGAIGLGVFLAWPKDVPNDEDRLRALVTDGARAATEHDLSALLKPVSPHYSGEFGDRFALASVLGRELPALIRADVEPASLKLHVVGPKATADFVAMFSGGGADLWSHFIHLDFEKTADGWQIVGASTRVATAADLVP